MGNRKRHTTLIKMSLSTNLKSGISTTKRLQYMGLGFETHIPPPSPTQKKKKQQKDCSTCIQIRVLEFLHKLFTISLFSLYMYIKKLPLNLIITNNILQINNNPYPICKNLKPSLRFHLMIG